MDTQEVQQDAHGVGPGVSAAATSSSRWRRMLDAGRCRSTPAGEGATSAERTVTFVVDPETALLTDIERATPRDHSSANSGYGRVVELADASSPTSLRRVRAALAEARTGWRFRLVGDEPALGALRATLHEAGVLDEEITLVLAELPTGGARVPVFCGHCQATTLGPPEESVVCSGCELQLTVYYHYSRRQGAYLGYFADAELAPA